MRLRDGEDFYELVGMAYYAGLFYSKVYSKFYSKLKASFVGEIKFHTHISNFYYTVRLSY